jgi:small subunit ribosomal protein S1
MSDSFAELFEESLKTVDMKPGSIVTGVIIDIDNEWVTVHAGLKSEGVISRDEFLDANGKCSLSIGEPNCLAKRPSVPNPGKTSKQHTKPTP